MKKLFMICAAMMFSFALIAQNDVDAFRFSQANWSGTARFMGAGGASAPSVAIIPLSQSTPQPSVFTRKMKSPLPLSLSMPSVASPFTTKNRLMATAFVTVSPILAPFSPGE